MIDRIQEMANVIYQGRLENVKDVLMLVSECIEMILKSQNKMASKGIAFPMEYVNAAVVNVKNAAEIGDEYVLADTLMYELKEIMTVYYEIMEEVNCE